MKAHHLTTAAALGLFACAFAPTIRSQNTADAAKPAAAKTVDDTLNEKAIRLEEIEFTEKRTSALTQAPTESRLDVVQPQSVIDISTITNSIAPSADYTMVANIAPSVTTVQANGPGLSEAKNILRGFSDGQYNVTYDGIPFSDNNSFSHHSTSYFPAKIIGRMTVDRGPGTASTIGEATFGGTIAMQSKDPRTVAEVNIGAHHSHEQQMRMFAPLFEKHQVNFVLSGHEHNYQRTQPLRFAPRDTAKAKNLNSKDRLIAGEFTIDRNFDGERTTRAEGVIYITTGAGGKYLYDPEFNNAPEKWSLPEDGNVRYVAQMVSDRHSLTIFDVERDEVLLRQIDERGNEIDRIRLTAPTGDITKASVARRG